MYKHTIWNTGIFCSMSEPYVEWSYSTYCISTSTEIRNAFLNKLISWDEASNLPGNKKIQWIVMITKLKQYIFMSVTWWNHKIDDRGVQRIKGCTQKIFEQSRYEVLRWNLASKLRSRSEKGRRQRRLKVLE